jgi:hypothetical protein
MIEKQKQNLRRARISKGFGKKIGLMAAVFGCWHKNLSRPFTYGGDSYCVCLKCGAHRNFNAQTLISSGSFYFPPIPSGH